MNLVASMVLSCALAALMAGPLSGPPAAAQSTAAYAHPEMLVSADWLAAHLDDAGIRIVDLRPSGYAEGHIPGAVHLDNAAIRDVRNAPAFVPSTQDFERLMAQLGIGPTSRVV